MDTDTANTILGAIKQDEPQEGDVYTCIHPAVMNGVMFCDGNCWMCGYHQKQKRFVFQKTIQENNTDENDKGSPTHI